MDKLLVRKDVYEELLEKGFGKKDLSKLTKKQITDKNGHKRTVYVRNGEQPVTQKQPTAQKELSPEKRARYEEMLEKVKAGPNENALFIGSKGMLNKKDAIAYLEGKLRKKSVSSAAQGHLESDTPQNTDITKEDEERFGKQALSGLSGKRTDSDDEKKPTQDDMIENYLDAKNEGGRDIADENRIDTHSKNAINLSDSDVKKMQKVFDYIPENATASQIMNTLYDEDKALYNKLSEMDIEYKKLHPEAEGKTFGFDLASKYLEDSFNEYKKDHEVGKDKFADMSVEDIRKEQQNLLDDYNQYYNSYKNGKNDGSKLREYFKKFDVYKTAIDKKNNSK